jgi:hypothetical protein
MCPDCGARCTGRFKGCDEVWARGPLGTVPIQARPAPRPRVTMSSAPLEQQEIAVRTAPGTLTPPGAQGTDDELALLEGSLEDLGKLSRSLDEQSAQRQLNGTGPVAANGLQVILEELNVLTKEIRAQRLSWANGDARPVEPPPAPATPSDKAPDVPPAALAPRPDPPPPSPVRTPRPWSHSVS